MQIQLITCTERRAVNLLEVIATDNTPSKLRIQNVIRIGKLNWNIAEIEECQCHRARCATAKRTMSSIQATLKERH